MTLRRKIALWLLAALVLSLSLGGVLLSGYLIKLDQDIRNRFAGARWALPAQVFAAPLELYPSLALHAGQLHAELDRLGYRAATALEGPGTYVASAKETAIATRAFQFWDGAQPALQLAVATDKTRITAVRDLEAGAPRDIVRLDPMLIGSIYPQQGEDRVLVKLSEVPPLLKDGLVAVEDRSFYGHPGLSLRAILRATLANLRAGHVVQGGSTLTQQLIKNFFLNSDQTWQRKINEAFMALLLEKHYSKDEILEAYFNEVHLGQDGSRAVHGFGLGAQFYFNKPLAELRTHEIALLVGVVKGSSHYNPRRHPQRTLERRNLVLRLFLEAKLITEIEYEDALSQPLDVAGEKKQGVARYPAFVDLVRRQLRGQYQEADLTHEGLRIFTTLDPRAQDALEHAITETLPELEQAKAKSKTKPVDLEAAGVVTSVDGGEVLALVGGREVRFPGYNRAVDSRRSIGSLAKPFVFLTGLMQPEQFNLHSILPDEPIEVRLPNKTVWAPKNYDRQLHGPVPLYQALAQSFNLPTVHVGLAVGEQTVRDVLVAAGYSGDAPALPSLFLGAVDIAPIEVAQMYATLASGGYQTPLTAIREVQTKDGQPLTRYPIKLKQTLPEGPVFLINWALRQVMQLGTGQGAYRVIRPDIVLAGKTGTTDDYRDSWFAGYGADRVGVIWVGRDDNKPTGLSGSNGALPIWAKAMRDIGVHGLEPEPLPPEDVEEVLTDGATGLVADEDCTGAYIVPYLRGYAPAAFAPCAEGNPVEETLDWFKGWFGG